MPKISTVDRGFSLIFFRQERGLVLFWGE